MAAWNCGWCGQFGEMKPTDAWRMAPQSDYERFKRIGVAEQPLLSALFVCPRCEGASLGVAVPRAIEYEFSRAEIVGLSGDRMIRTNGFQNGLIRQPTMVCRIISRGRLRRLMKLMRTVSIDRLSFLLQQ